MSCQEFITNLNGLRDGGNFPKELLKVRHGGCSGARSLSSLSQGQRELTPGFAETSWRGQAFLTEGNEKCGSRASRISVTLELISLCEFTGPPPPPDLLNQNLRLGPYNVLSCFWVILRPEKAWGFGSQGRASSSKSLELGFGGQRFQGLDSVHSLAKASSSGARDHVTGLLSQPA